MVKSPAIIDNSISPGSGAENGSKLEKETQLRRGCCGSRRRPIFIASVISALVIIGLAVGLGIGLTRGGGGGGGGGSSGDNSSSNNTASTPPSTNTTTITSGNTTFWAPAASTPWQIVLEYALNDTSAAVPIYDIDLFDNPSSTISSLHNLSRHVICYFSAGSYENFRPDAANFTSSDYGNELDGWPGEYWLNTSSANVRRIMQARLDMAVERGCDGVDPDNVDGYDNDNGLGLTQADAVEYVLWLADEAHTRNLSLGLKNAGEIINATISDMQWSVNEQCEQYQECETFWPFLEAGKPIFHIEYPTVGGEMSVVSAEKKANICDDSSAKGFSTVMKNMDLDDWVEYC